MPLEAPNLDDRRYDDIVAEFLRLKPRFLPEWTDCNDSDPGVALAKLFAWMTDLTLYRMNRVPDRVYIKMLQMVGIERIQASPAGAVVRFTPSRDDVAEIVVPAGTQVAAGGDEDGPIVFETTEAAPVLGAPLSAIQVWDGFSHSQATTAAEAEGQTFHPFGPRARDGAALMLGFAGPAPATNGPIHLYVRTAETDGPPPRESRTDPAKVYDLPPPAALVWEYFDATHWQPLTLLRDETTAFTRDGLIVLRGPGTGAKLTARGDVAEPLYWLRCRVETASWEKAPDLDAILVNCVEARQHTTLRGEILGRSLGVPNQTFTLSRRPVLMRKTPETTVTPDGRVVTIRSVALEVDEGAGFTPWQEVEDFHASGPEDRHFTINHATGLVAFGSGEKGLIPPVFAPASGVGNIMARDYQSGGGRRGNLPGGAISTIQSHLPGVQGVINPFPATGGADEESVDAAKARAASEIAANGRAVTAIDFETLALQAGVRRAKALALTHPRYPGVEIPGSVTVIVVPDGDAPNPTPSAYTLAKVATHLDGLRLISTELHIVAPTYNEVAIEADIVTGRTANPETVREDLEARLNAFLHPLTGGADGLGWPFGGNIYYSDIYRLVIETRDILRLSDGQLAIRVNGELAPFCRDIEICPGELVFAGRHSLTLFPEGRG
ncbi:putative baseplate assembly protein [Roseovarius spongiae]|uniref:Putative baseplate assembly protein n=1 Tax=Roseovarius spongiae TaxID=2320272 RepID=A0A3A8AV08_9RHOB|nr:putative baseplate assembly protein [Roseovarius spongiae]RKF14887.1 putative baseplate assembly protein [Roseovarius spongiae]